MNGKGLLKHALAAAGGLRLSRWLGAQGGSVTVLRYHSISDHATYCPPSIAVSPWLFARQMRHLARHYQVISLDSATATIGAGGPLPARAACITFDDGYLDNFEAAFPILKQHGLTATLYVTAAPVLEGERFWVAWIQDCVAACSDPRPLAELCGLPARGKIERDVLASHLMTLVARSGMGGWAAIFDGIEAALPPSERRRRDAHAYMMQPHHLRELAAAGMTIGSHTVHHPILASLEGSEADAELRRSKSMLEAAIGQPVLHLAYPNGPGVARNFASRDQELCRLAGYRSAATSRRGTVARGDDPFALKRQGINEQLGFHGFGFKLEEHRFLGLAPS